jgi:hypothetical protein
VGKEPTSQTGPNKRDSRLAQREEDCERNELVRGSEANLGQISVRKGQLSFGEGELFNELNRFYSSMITLTFFLMSQKRPRKSTKR